MKDMAIHTRVNPGERIKRLTNFANRLLSTPEVNYFYLLKIVLFLNTSKSKVMKRHTYAYIPRSAIPS